MKKAKRIVRAEDPSTDTTTTTTEIMLSEPNDILRNNGIYYITGEIDVGSLLAIQQDILVKHLNPQWNNDIQLIINSTGGETAEAWALVDLLNFIRMDVRTIGLGCCASMGAILLASGTPGKRLIAPNTSVMIHGAFLAGFGGNTQQMATVMKDISQEFERHLQFWTTHSKYKTKGEIEKHFLDGFDKFMTAEEALGHGVVDLMVSTKPVAKKGKR